MIYFSGIWICHRGDSVRSGEMVCGKMDGMYAAGRRIFCGDGTRNDLYGHLCRKAGQYEGTFQLDRADHQRDSAGLFPVGGCELHLEIGYMMGNKHRMITCKEVKNGKCIIRITRGMRQNSGESEKAGNRAGEKNSEKRISIS